MDPIAQLVQRLTSFRAERVNPKVVQDMVLFFANSVSLADDELLARLYDSAAAFPHSSTKKRMMTHHGVVFNGPFGGGMPARCV